MTSLLIIRRGVDIVGHCDAVCYDARHPTCVCLACEGANHGVGYEQALINTRALVAGRLEQPPSDDGLAYELDPAVQHLPLFDL